MLLRGSVKTTMVDKNRVGESNQQQASKQGVSENHMKYEQILISYMYMYTHSIYTVRVTCSAAFSTLPGVGISSYIVIDTGEMSFGFLEL